ncbi:valine--tRNA ligase, mitochondrial isoform X3 [Hyalella azteca]|nr:valine--tRNA ligase, mitochondrial isoform X3 [Hyalella azteca]XP_047740266.1 valine--tRNA ligase, mitochondrial isoform X3 [Hyalella azteca]XP_047740267.1 valine--tRNA ligase, mitochondrial isoform X3 [Hyalella azteca]
MPPMVGTCPTASLHQKWYPVWKANKYFFRGKLCPNEVSLKNQLGLPAKYKQPFVVMLPPPNITGSLHLGHALTVSLQDTLVRWQGMLGRDVLWVPGCDHAGIATQVVLEKHLMQTTGKNRHQLGQEEFLRAAWEWKDSKESCIYDQLQKLGVALDWDCSVFTMSKDMSHSVVQAFIMLHDRGLIYRKPRPVNYCPALQSVISDIEVDHWKVTGPTETVIPGHDEPVMFGQMFDVAYPLVFPDGSTPSSGEHIVVSTTRPETIPADTAIMVHPQDHRYKHLIGKKAQIPCRPDRSIPIIADAAVDPAIGTGAVKVTPGLSAVDYAVGQRHHLPVMSNILRDGTLDSSVPSLQGLPRLSARGAMLSLLEERGLLRAVRPHAQTVPRCSRTGDVVETLVQKQWFVRVREMAERSCRAVENGDLLIDPPSQRNVWTTWMKQTQHEDWCISRQIWWGHRVPMYRIRHAADTEPLKGAGPLADDDGEVWLAAESETQALDKAAEMLGRSAELLRAEQDPDVLDTWFSSALFPFASLGWPWQSARLSRYYPTSVLVTGQDILFFWVARMVMLGTELTGQLPFKRVQLHGLICDSKGVKMSKSRGNVIDPMILIDSEYRAAASKSSHNTDPLYSHSSQNKSSTELSSQDPSSPAKSSPKQAEDKKSDHPTNVASNTTGLDLPFVGPDVLRMALLSTSLFSDHVQFGPKELDSFSKLPNKMWQSVKFLRMSCDRIKCRELLPLHKLTQDLGVMERWLLHHTGSLVSTADGALRSCNTALLITAFTTLWKSVLCDVFLEAVKPCIDVHSSLEVPDCAVESLKGPEMQYGDAVTSMSVMAHCMTTALLCIAPVMPHLAEELYHCMPTVAGSPKKPSIFAEAYPQHAMWHQWEDISVARQVDAWLEVVAAARSLKAAHGAAQKRASGVLYSECPHLTAAQRGTELSSVACHLAQLSAIEIIYGKNPEGCVQASLVTPAGENSVLHLNIPGVDVEQQAARLEKRLAKLARQLSVAKKYEWSNTEKINKLSNELQHTQRLKESLQELILRQRRPTS